MVEGKTPLKGLHHFIKEHIGDTINGVHILPFFPYSSDDGFSVIDYRMVNPELGDWRDIKKLSQHHRLMFDLVINHVSRESLWFYDFVANLAPAKDYFHALPHDTDVSQVTRPRNSPLLVPVTTRRGMLYVWATFSEDQIDVNFSNPEVLLEYLDILLLYIRNGARIIRLDAIAFLWKQLGTNCIHLEQTHEVVKLIRTLTNYVSPDTVILTETNVPHAENVSYFGQQDEAHMVYQFSLPPLLLHALWRGNAFADFTYEPFAQTEIARLEELRPEAVGARIDADLASGRSRELVSELESLARQHPLREEFSGQLMLALYRFTSNNSGRRSTKAIATCVLDSGALSVCMDVMRSHVEDGGKHDSEATGMRQSHRRRTRRQTRRLQTEMYVRSALGIFGE